MHSSEDFIDVINDTLVRWNASIFLSGYRVKESRLRKEEMNGSTGGGGMF